MTDNETILFDTWKHAYREEFIESLKTVINPKNIDCMVIHHMEPDHSGAIPKVLELSGNKTEVWGHPLVRDMLKSFYGISPKFRALMDGEKVTIGDKMFRFIYTPWLHWPETMMTFILDHGVLLSGDAFGGFSIPLTIFDDDERVVSDYLVHVRKYVVNIVGHYIDRILKAADKLREKKVSPKIIAPAHGLIFKNNPEAILNYYIDLAKGSPEKGKIAVIYSSMYGSVEKAISLAIDELKRNGVNPVIHKFTDMERLEISEAISDVIDAEAVIIGAATYENDVFPYMKHLLEVLVAKVRVGKPVLVISSYGWGGVAGLKISKKLSEAGFKVLEKVEFRGQPKREDLEKVKRGVKSLLRETKSFSSNNFKRGL